MSKDGCASSLMVGGRVAHFVACQPWGSMCSTSSMVIRVDKNRRAMERASAGRWGLGAGASSMSPAQEDRQPIAMSHTNFAFAPTVCKIV